jgi:diguanylate cyclase
MAELPGAGLRSPLEAMHLRRVRLMLQLGSGIVCVASLGWALVFALRGAWAGLAVELLTFLMAAGALVLQRQRREQAASRLLLATMFVLVCLTASFLDVPTAQVPRSAHQFLLAVGVASCLLLRQERPWLRHGAPLLALGMYAAYACGWLDLVTPPMLPDSLRASGQWVNCAVALGLVYLALQIIQADVAERNGLEAELREALMRGEMLLHYQPQVGAGNRILGAEALLRWRHPRRGMVPPGEFIALAERSGLMLPLGDWVLRTACTQLAAWGRRPETAELSLAVNVSASQFAQADFVARVLSSVEQSGANPARLKLELTESMLAHDVDDLIAKMAALRTRGIAFSLDDFGTGFSSLSYLQRLPLDQLKIDQAFVRNLLASASDAAIAQAVVTLGRSLGLQVIAEGVETLEQRRFLAGIGCEAYQGYLFSRPLPIAEFDALLEGRSVAAVPQPASAAALPA